MKRGIIKTDMMFISKKADQVKPRPISIFHPKQAIFYFFSMSRSPRSPRFTTAPHSPRAKRPGRTAFVGNGLDNSDHPDDDDDFSPLKPYRGHTIRLEKFGSFSPSWTIGSSRRPARISDESPGPGEYEPKYKAPTVYSWSRAPPPPVKRPLTLDLEYENTYKSTFGDPKHGAKIGIRKDTVFWTPTQSPPIFYDPKSTLSRKSCRIHEWYKPRQVPQSPGPGEYEIKNRETYKLLTMSKVKERDVFKNWEPNNPGPGAYEIVKYPRRINNWFKDRRVTKPKEESSSLESSRMSYMTANRTESNME